MKKSSSLLALILVFASAFGQETVTVSKKPLSPRAGRVLKIREALRVSDAQGDFFFKNPDNIQAAPDGGFFVLDDGEFLRFDAKGKFLGNLFRQGQGPGEFQRIENYLVGETDVLAFQRNPMKFVRMDMGGKLLRDFKPDAPVTRFLGRAGERFVSAHNSYPPVEKVNKPEGEILDITWTLQFVSGEGAVESTLLTFPTKWFAKRLPGALIADDLTSLLWAPLGKGMIAVAHGAKYALKIGDLDKREVVRTIVRDYKSVKYEPEKDSAGPGGSRRLSVPRDFFNDVQKLFAVGGKIWVVTSTLVPEKGVLVDVIGPNGEYLDAFFLPLPKDVGLHGLARLPLTVAGRTILTVEVREDGQPEVVKYEILD